MDVAAVVDLGSHLTPEVIRHPRLGLSWTVTAVVEDWTTRRYRDAVGAPEVTKRFRVRASGPMPGEPSADGEFIMVVRRYGNRSGWWIGPDPEDP
jgi:hypothetical protein